MTLEKRQIHPRIERWAIELMQFDYITEHRAGSKMQHEDALRVTNILVVDDNPLELELAVNKNRDTEIRAIRRKLEKTQDKCYEMHNGIVYRKKDTELLFYVPKNMENHILRKYHDEVGHLGTEKACNEIEKSYWFPQLKSKINQHINNCLKCIVFS